MDASWTQHTHAAGDTPVVLPAGANANLTVVLEPDSGVDIILNAIKAASKSIWIEMYTFTDPRVANALAQAVSNGVDVQLIYEPSVGQNALLQLSSSQQFPTWARQNLAVDIYGNAVAKRHAKFMIIDGGISGQEQAYIMTANFSEEALGGSWQCANREYIICDTDPQDIQMLMTIFQADQKGQALPQLTAPNLVISTNNAHALLSKLIGSAAHSIYIQVEDIQDPNSGSPTAQSLSIEGALVNAAQKGLDVRLMIPPLSSAGTKIPSLAANGTAVSYLTQSKPTVLIRTSPQYYIHAKLIIIDALLAYVGSQNLSRQSLGYNREVGIIIVKPDIVQTLCDTFAQDWNGGQDIQASTSAAPA